MSSIANRFFPAPLNFLLRQAQIRHYPGKYRLFVWLKRYFSHKVIRYPINQAEFCVPLQELCFWLEGGPQQYYPQDILPFARAINQLEGERIFIDCGADIGTVSMMVNAELQADIPFICIEPNPNAFELLQANQPAIGRQVRVLPYAISNFEGHARLNFNRAQISDHEAHLALNEDGDTRVTTVDTLSRELGFEHCPNIVLKVDVEGQEQALFEGAKALISQAKQCIILLEIHPDVLAREGLQAEYIFAQVEQYGDFSWTVPELDNQVVDRNREFYTQFALKQYDVMGVKRSN